jgi:hypothetical protein
MAATLSVRTVLVLAVVAAACGTPSTPSMMPTGVWGGDHIALTVEVTSAHVELDCAHGNIPIRLPDAAFTVAGTFVREHGGPILVDETLDSRPALYVASMSGGVMTLTIRLGDSGELVGTFTLTRGSSGRVFKCL